MYSSTKTLTRLGRTFAINRKISRLAMSSRLVGRIDVAGGTVSDEEGDTTTGIFAGVVLGGGKANGGKRGQNRYRYGVMHCC